MIRGLLIIIILWVQYNQAYSKVLCDGINETELVRIYFVNGMGNTLEGMELSRLVLQNGIGNMPKYEYRVGVNLKESMHEQLYELLRQRLADVNLDSREFWKWYNNPTAPTTPSIFQKAFGEVLYSASYSEVNTDTDLQAQISRYLQDLRAGKKVVLVAHSQGNFYANNAYAYITKLFPSYSNSIGIVAVGTPASFVADSGLYTQNANDQVIFYFVESVLGFNVVPPNVVHGNKLTSENHSFINSYLGNESAKIFSDVNATINRLDQPEIDAECDDGIAKIITLNAKKVTTESAILEGRLTNGKNVNVWAVYDKNPSNVSCSLSFNNGIGPYTAETVVERSINNLDANTTYYARFCAKGSIGGVRDGGLIVFITERKEESAVITTSQVSRISNDRADLVGYLSEGKGAIIWVNYTWQGVPNSCSLETWEANKDRNSVTHNAQYTSVISASNLYSETYYLYRFCAHNGVGDISDGGVKSFNTL